MVSKDKLPPPKKIREGVYVSPTLQVNEMSLSEWHNRTTWDPLYERMTRDQLIATARKMGYAEEDIREEFGIGA